MSLLNSKTAFINAVFLIELSSTHLFGRWQVFLKSSEETSYASNRQLMITFKSLINISFYILLFAVKYQMNTDT